MRLNHRQIFFATNSLVLMPILTSIFCRLQILHQFYFLRFPLFYWIQHCSLISTASFHLCLHFFLLLLFFVCWILHLVLDIVIDWVLIRDVFALVLILVSSIKVLIMKQIPMFIKKVKNQFFNNANRKIGNL